MIKVTQPVYSIYNLATHDNRHDEDPMPNILSY